jgi:serine/threonine protein kinase
MDCIDTYFKFPKEFNGILFLLKERGLVMIDNISCDNRSLVLLVANSVGKYVIKVKKNNDKLLRLESKNLEKLDHPQIVKKLGFFESNFFSVLELEYIDGMSIISHVIHNGPLIENDIKEIVLKLISILQYILDKKLVYMDIKPDNIILNEKTRELVLVDFEMLFEIDGNVTYNYIVGTKEYRSPEIGLKPYKGPETMVWALGITIFVMATANFPTWRIVRDQRKINHGNYSSNLRDLISNILNDDPSKRPTLGEIVLHNFFT